MQVRSKVLAELFEFVAEVTLHTSMDLHSIYNTEVCFGTHLRAICTIFANAFERRNNVRAGIEEATINPCLQPRADYNTKRLRHGPLRSSLT